MPLAMTLYHHKKSPPPSPCLRLTMTLCLLKNDTIIGKITSAVYSPRLKKNIALAIISIEQSKIGNRFQVNTNEGVFNCVVVEKPFWYPHN